MGMKKKKSGKRGGVKKASLADQMQKQRNSKLNNKRVKEFEESLRKRGLKK